MLDQFGFSANVYVEKCLMVWITLDHVGSFWIILNQFGFSTKSYVENLLMAWMILVHFRCGLVQFGSVWYVLVRCDVL